MESKKHVLTEKMKWLLVDIINSLRQLPEEVKNYTFGISIEENVEWLMNIANEIALEYIKYSYDYQDKEYPLNHFIKDLDESEQMTQKRINQYAMNYKKKELNRLDFSYGKDPKYKNIDMDTMKKKLAGYRLTEMNYYEHQIIHDVDLIKAIVEKRIVSVKKVSNTRFVEMFEQYDEVVEKLIERSKKSDEDMVFASLAFFTLEWLYVPEFVYFLACIMEEKNMKEIDRKVLGLFCGRPQIESIFGGIYSLDSRMVKDRFMYSHNLLFSDMEEIYKEELFTIVKEILVLITQYKEGVTSTEGGLYKDWFRKESNMHDWASFFRYYKLFDIWRKKDLTKKRIQNMRKIYDVIIEKN